jgi:hypothetical protein
VVGEWRESLGEEAEWVKAVAELPHSKKEKRPRERGLFSLGAKIGTERYQLSFRANWN